MSKEIITIEGQKYELISNQKNSKDNDYTLYKGLWYKPVKEEKPEWEALTYQQYKGDLLYDLKSDGFYHTRNRGTKYHKDSFFNCPIIAVKRLADGAVFSIGDYIDGFKDPIQKIILNYNKKYIWLSTSETLNDGCDLIYATKADPPKPLFTTEDGVELFSKEAPVYSVCPKATWDTREFNAGFLGHVAKNFTGGGWKAWKHFSSPERREEYIMLNKPVLSLVDVVMYTRSPEEVRKLKELVKSKL